MSAPNLEEEEEEEDWKSIIIIMFQLPIAVALFFHHFSSLAPQSRSLKILSSLFLM